jgi:hypothetical protein
MVFSRSARAIGFFAKRSSRIWLSFRNPAVQYPHWNAKCSMNENTKSLDDERLADDIRKTTYKTVVGEVKFGAQGEWAESRVLQVQFQHIKSNDIAQFKDVSTQVVLTPAQCKSGAIIYPYEKAKPAPLPFRSAEGCLTSRSAI